MASGSASTTSGRKDPLGGYDIAERLSVEEINLELDSNMTEILRLFGRRRELIQLKRKMLGDEYSRKQQSIKQSRNNDLAAELRVSGDREMTTMLASLDSYSRNKQLIGNIWTHSISALSKSESDKTRRFWQANKTLETNIDHSLKQLKSCDQAIDRIVNEEFQVCTAIDEYEEQIRQILRKKEEDHIRKAQPYSNQKNKLLAELQNKQHEREKVKDSKRQIIRNIMALLEQLRGHREERAQSITNLFQGDLTLHSYQEFLDSLEVFARSREGLATLQQEQTSVQDELNNAFSKSIDAAHLFTERQSDEAKLFIELNGFYRQKIKLLAMEKLFAVDVLPDGAARNIGQLLNKCKQYKKVLEAAIHEDQLVRGGLARTRETIDVFDKVLKSIDSEKHRRQRLLLQLEKIQQHHNQLVKDEQHKRDLQVEVENLRNKRKQLQEHLNELATQADLTGYKRTTEDLSSLDRDIRSKQQHHQLMEEQLASKKRELIGFTNSIKSDFNDILKEVVPSSWMNNHDLKKFENIFELNVYLKKTFKRLNL